MAIFKSEIIAAASGSIAGITFSHNKGGMYMRARTIPTNPNSTYQQAIRTAVAQLSNLWLNTLTPVQREGWETYAANVELVNALGDPIIVTGLNHYIRSNVPRIQGVEARVDNPPTTYNLGDFTQPPITVDALEDNIGVTFLSADDWASETGSAMLIYVSRPQNPSIVFFKGPYRYSGKINGVDGDPPLSPVNLPTPFNYEAGQRAFARVRVTRVDGRLSASFRDTALAT